MYRALLIGDPAGVAPYHPIEAFIPPVKQALEGLCDVEVSYDYQKFFSLSDYDFLVLMNDCFGERVFEDQYAIALARYVENGGRLLAIHGGTCAGNNPNALHLFRAPFSHHPAMAAFTVSPCLDHPITQGVTPYEVFDEPYHFKPFQTPPDALFLCYPWDGADVPAGWMNRVGDGMVIYLSSGHTADLFEIPSLQKLIRNSAQYLMDEIK